MRRAMEHEEGEEARPSGRNERQKSEEVGSARGGQEKASAKRKYWAEYFGVRRGKLVSEDRRNKAELEGWR